eukprot:UN25053
MKNARKFRKSHIPTIKTIFLEIYQWKIDPLKDQENMLDEETIIQKLTTIKERYVDKELKSRNKYPKLKTIKTKQEQQDNEFIEKIEEDEQEKINNSNTIQTLIKDIKTIWNKTPDEKLFDRLDSIKNHCLEREKNKQNKYPKGTSEIKQERSDAQFLYVN